jgi:hypothetical protein
LHPQSGFHLLQLGEKSLPDGFAQHEERSILPGLSANVRKPKEVERLRFALSLLLSISDREPPELNQAGFARMLSWEGYGLASGEETQYPVISVVWDDGAIDYPNEYIGKCMEAFERFDLPEEIYEQGQMHQAILEGIEAIYESLAEAFRRRHSDS